MYDFHKATDTLKFWTEKRAVNKTFFVCFSSYSDETWWNCSTHGYLQLHQVSSKSDEKQNKKKVLLIAYFSVQNFKVSVESVEKWVEGKSNKAFLYFLPNFGHIWWFFKVLQWLQHARSGTMYDFNNSTDTLKFWAEK